MALKLKVAKLHMTGVEDQWFAYVGSERKSGFRWNMSPVVSSNSEDGMKAWLVRNGLKPDDYVSVNLGRNGYYDPNDGVKESILAAFVM